MYSEEELRKLLMKDPRPPARDVESRFSTGVLLDLDPFASPEEKEIARQMVNEVQQTPTAGEAYKLSLLARIIERAKAIRLGHAP